MHVLGLDVLPLEETHKWCLHFIWYVARKHRGQLSGSFDSNGHHLSIQFCDQWKCLADLSVSVVREMTQGQSILFIRLSSGKAFKKGVVRRDESL